MTTPQNPERRAEARSESDLGTPAGPAATAAARVHRHLEASTDHIELPSTPLTQLKAVAGRRAMRRRRAAVVGLVAAASIGVVGGIAVLSQSSSTSVIVSSESDDPDEAPSTDVPESDPTSAPATVTVVADPGEAVQPGPEADAAELGSVDDADVFGELGVPQQADPAFVWRVVDPGKEASISSSFGGAFDASSTSFAVSTAPGRSNDYDNIETFLYRSDDGISWSRTGAQAPFAAAFWNATVSTDRIFVTGTAPGIAKDQPNPLQIAVGTGEAWEIAELPIDTNADTALPMIGSSGPQISSVPYGDGVLVVVADQAFLDYREVSVAAGARPNELQIIDQQPDGVVLIATECLDQAYGSFDSSVELFGPVDGSEIAPPSTVAGAYEDGADYLGCPVTAMSWTDLGVPTESVDALSAPMSRFFVVSAALDVVEIDAPSNGTYFAVGRGEPVVELVDQSFAGNPFADGAPPRYELVDGAWVESGSSAPTSLARQGAELQDLGDQRMGFFGTRRDGQVPFMSIAADGTQSGVDLESVLLEDSSSWAEYTVTTATHWVGAVQSFIDPIAARGGIEVTFSDVTLRQASEQSRFELFDTATGELIDRALVVGDDEGNVEVLTDDGAVRASFTVEDVYNAMSEPFEDRGAPEATIVTTADGRSFSVESVSSLLGIENSDVSRIARVSTDGTTVIVTVALTDRYADDTRKQLVLVGTPIG